MRTMRWPLGAAWAVLAAFPVQGQTNVNLSGRVVNASGTPLANVSVELIGLRRVVQTDANGRFSITGSSPIRPRPAADAAPWIRNGRLYFSLPDADGPVRLSLYNALGKSRLLLQGEDFPQGRNSVDLNAKLSGIPFTGVRFLELSVGDRRYVFKDLDVLGSASGAWAPAEEMRPLFKGASAPDSLHFNLKGYEDRVVSVSGPDAGQLPDVVLRTGIAFEQYFVGSGLIRNIATGQDVRIPKEQMYHVVYLPEGYTQADLDAGRYAADIKRWYDDVFRISPISAFKEAFVIWAYPVPSPERTGGNTYFRLNFGGTPTDGSTARKLWEILDKNPFTPKYFDGNRCRNWVAQFAILDPSSLRSGFSGNASTYSRPGTSQSISAAHAQTHHHEFYHSFSRVSDEYYDRGHGSVSFSALSNLGPSTRCGELPWKHLVYGAEFNKTADSLVGAFGGTTGRYHSELKCLMNGSHHNADIFGGSNNLRTMDRMCNWCRELSLFRLYHGVGMIPGSASSAFTAWGGTYRRPYWTAFPFFRPNPTPQTNSVGQKWFMRCTP